MRLDTTYRARRTRLFDLLPSGCSVVLHNGFAPCRNVPSSSYAFRGASSVQYLCGRLPQGAVVLLDRDDATLFLIPQSASDRVWDGPGEGWDRMAELHAFDRVLARDRCAELCAKRSGTLLSLPVLSGRGQGELRDILERDVALAGADLSLAEALIALRLCQDEFAQQQLRAAIPPTAAAYRRAREQLRPGLNERHVLAELVAEAIRWGMELSFPPIVSKRAEILHNTESKDILEEGDLLLIDFGVETPEGYASDVTRTWPVGERFSDRQRDVYQIVLEAQQAAIAAVKPGTEYWEVHLVASRALARGLIDLGMLSGEVDSLVERGAHALFFPHGIGHLVGLDVHDLEEFGDLAGYAPGRARDPRFGFNFLRLNRPLQSGMVVSIEPGLYFVPALLDCPERRALYADCVRFDRVEPFRQVRGIRIEDEVLVADSGHEVLTACIPKQIEG